VSAWRPAVPGIAEVFHAHFTDHAYPAHTHAEWTLLIVDDGAIRYGLDRHVHGAAGATVSLLPPHVSHDGRAATRDGFRKRVLYLDEKTLGADLIGRAVDMPTVRDPLLRHRIDQLHRILNPGALRFSSPEALVVDLLEAESRLVLICDRLRAHILATEEAPAGTSRAGALAGALRDLLDAHVVPGLTLREAGAVLHADPSHLVRTFTTAFGLPPHTYLTGRRVDKARHLLLAGMAPAQVATETGFHDQPHLTRTFARHLGTPPARYAASARRRSA
jgi:AraC-like DNA-binding protein